MKSKQLFWILFGLNLLNYLDRQVLYAVFPLIQTDLHLTDFQLGTLASAFMIVYMCYAPFMGYLADRLERSRLISISALLWSGATLFCATAKNYVSLLTARSLIGVGEGGFTTLAQPFLAEHYPKEKHAFVLACFGLALPIGSALGYMLGGLIGQHWGWRIAFSVAGIPGIFLGILAVFSLTDSARKNPSISQKPSWREYLPLFKNKPFLRVCFSQAMITFLMGGLAAWMPMYLHRYLALDAAQAGTYFGILVVVCGAIGTFIGGHLASWWLTRSAKAYAYVIMYSLLGALPLCWFTLGLANPLGIFGCLSMVLILLFFPTGAIAAALVETTPAPIRSMAFAINIFFIHLLGDALSPTLVGWISEGWNLKMAVWVSSLVLLPGAFAAYRMKS